MGVTALAPRIRLNSVDMLRGLVLVIMALDHTRDMISRPLSTDYSGAVDFAGFGRAGRLESGPFSPPYVTDR